MMGKSRTQLIYMVRPSSLSDWEKKSIENFLISCIRLKSLMDCFGPLAERERVTSIKNQWYKGGVGELRAMLRSGLSDGNYRSLIIKDNNTEEVLSSARTAGA